MINNRSLIALVSMSLSFLTNANTVLEEHDNKHSSDNSMLVKRGIDNAMDDIYEDQDVDKIKLTDEQKHEAKVWGLTEDEEKRYIALKDNKAKYFYEKSTKTPVDILGLNARNDKERNHFAKIAIVQETTRVARELAWNSAFKSASNSIYKNKPVISNFDTTQYSPRKHQSVKLSNGDNLHLFVKKNDPTVTLTSELISAIELNDKTKLSIYIIDGSENDVEMWASRNGIPLTLHKAGRVDLNIGKENYENLQVKNKNTPLLILSRGNVSSTVTLGDFNEK